MNVCKYPSPIIRPVKCTALYWVPSPVEHGLPNWRSKDHEESRPIIRKSRSSRIPRLPAELITEIVSHIWHEETLKVCARTARVFMYQAYKNLYVVVTLCFPNRLTCWDKTPGQLLRLLTKSPHIANLIQDLRVHVGTDYNYDDPTNSLASTYDEEGRQNLHRVVALLRNLRSLSFPRFGAHYRNHASKRTNTPFFPKLSEYQSRKLRVLDISALTDEQFPPFESLTALTNIRDLTMDFLFRGTNIFSKFYWVPPLRSLAFFGHFDIQLASRLLLDVGFPLKVNYDNLRILEIEQRDQFMVYLAPRDLTFLTLLLAVCTNVKEFRFSPCPCVEYSMKTLDRLAVYPDISAPPDISSVLSLETIILEAVVEAVESGPRGYPAETHGLAACPMPWIIEFFKKISRPSSVREIELRFNILFKWSCGPRLMQILYSFWDDLVDVLLSWRFPRLRRVKISIDMLRTFGTNVRPFCQIDAYPGLKKLKRAGLLVLDL